MKQDKTIKKTTANTKNVLFTSICLISMLLLLNIASATTITLGSSVPDVSSGSDVVVTLLNQEPYPVSPGDYVTLRFKVENKGLKDIENFYVRLIPNYPFTLADDEVKYLGNLWGLQQGNIGATVTYKLKVDKDAYPGYFDVDFEYTQDKKTWFKIEGFTVKVESADVRIGVKNVSLTPQELAPGEKGRLNIIVENTGDSLIKDITLKLDLTLSTLTQQQLSLLGAVGIKVPFSPLNSATEQKVKNLMPGEKKTFSFDIITSPTAEADVYKIPILLTYYDTDNTKHEKQDLISVIVSGKPDIKILLEDATVFLKNQKGKIVLKIVNSGRIDAKFVNIKLENTKDFYVLSQNNNYVGDVDSDDYETAEFEVFVGNTNKDILIPVTLNYEDPLGKKYELVEQIPLKIYTVAEAKKYGLIRTSKLLGIVIVILLVGIGYYIYNKVTKQRGKE